MALRKTAPPADSKSPESVTHGFSFNDSRLVYALLNAETGNQRVVLSSWTPLARGWYAISLTNNAYTSVQDEHVFRREFRLYPGPLVYVRGCVHGMDKVGYTLPQKACAGNRWAEPLLPFANIITQTILFDYPGAAVRDKGCGPFCLGEALLAVRKNAKEHYERGLCQDTIVPQTLAEQPYAGKPSSATEATKTQISRKTKEAIGFHLHKYAAQNGKQVSKKPPTEPQSLAISKRAQATVMAFWNSPSLRRQSPV